MNVFCTRFEEQRSFGPFLRYSFKKSDKVGAFREQLDDTECEIVESRDFSQACERRIYKVGVKINDHNGDKNGDQQLSLKVYDQTKLDVLQENWKSLAEKVPIRVPNFHLFIDLSSCWCLLSRAKKRACYKNGTTRSQSASK